MKLSVKKSHSLLWNTNLLQVEVKIWMQIIIIIIIRLVIIENNYKFVNDIGYSCYFLQDISNFKC